jgi:hypothetical protein
MDSDTASRAADYRRLATEAMERAVAARDPAVAARLMQIAEKFEELARFEASKALEDQP